MNLTVIFGANEFRVTDIAPGTTVQTLYDDNRTGWNLPSNTSPDVNNEKVNFSHKLSNGDTVEFRKSTGNKA